MILFFDIILNFIFHNRLKNKTNITYHILLEFSVYPSGAMLEMSNGYPGSTSPLGAGATPSPSPGPAPSPHPSMSGRHHKPHHSPPAPRSHNNLRVLIPQQMAPPPDELSYSEVYFYFDLFLFSYINRLVIYALFYFLCRHRL